ncbi:hypothetical protein [Actinosynnema mirum]|uniref:Uncharacterized protein n=1 Tax=Actinosynnema mirum (strain ATCC 29888 / DSM 43827 / JCM 3225 / NBRC 14064 / NCIMB 13271 / NRRL B-12336 / IMRU 3971 / 101) TaxID=446462 RepID=C6WB95_ACTMD|nr:hypothetical protein [Actinosynnema mirum]ACU39386.1 hypothetical protein Amir_5568 [Actinosynnema mirum DSM 43827]
MITNAEYAAALAALADHLQVHPHLAAVNIERGSQGGLYLQVASHTSLGEPARTPALIDWADSLRATNVTATAFSTPTPSGSVHVHITGSLADGTPIKVWSAIDELTAVTNTDGHPIAPPVDLDVLRVLAAPVAA